VEDTKINNKIKKKKNKGGQNKVSKKNKDYSDDEEDYYTFTNKINLHNIKFDLPPEEYENYNNNRKNINKYEYNNYFLEENMIQEAIKKSLVDK